MVAIQGSARRRRRRKGLDMMHSPPIRLELARPRGMAVSAAAGLALVLLLAAGAQAQGVDCGQMQTQIVALSHVDPGRSLQYVRAAQKQQAELDHLREEFPAWTIAFRWSALGSEEWAAFPHDGEGYLTGRTAVGLAAKLRAAS